MTPDPLPPGEEDDDFDGLDGPLDAEALEDAALEDLEDEDLDEDLEGEGEGEDGDAAEDGDGSDEDSGPAKKGKEKKAAKKKSAKRSKTAIADEEEEVLHPDTKVPQRASMRAALDKAFEGQDDVDDALLEGFTTHALELLEKNRVMNLTSILDPDEVAVKHFLDSWRVTRLVPVMARRILDLGSGGGFPGIPIAMAEPMCSVVLCDSIKKKADFLRELVEKLGLRNVTVTDERAEEFLTKEQVDLVVVRAVSSVRENVRTLRKVRHAVKDVVMLKGSSWGREIRAAEREAERLGFKLDTVLEHELPDEMGQRAIVVYRAPGGAGL